MTATLYKYLAILLVLLSLWGYVWYLKVDNTSLKAQVTSYKVQVQEAGVVNKDNLGTIASLTSANAGWAQQHVNDQQKISDLGDSLTKQGLVLKQQQVTLSAAQAKDPKGGVLAQSLDSCCSSLASRLRAESAALN